MPKNIDYEACFPIGSIVYCAMNGSISPEEKYESGEIVTRIIGGHKEIDGEWCIMLTDPVTHDPKEIICGGDIGRILFKSMAKCHEQIERNETKRR